MDKRLMGIILAMVVAAALLMYFSRDILFEMRKLRRPHGQVKETETAEPAFTLSAELLQKRAESAEARGDWASAKKYYERSLDLEDSELAKKGLRIMDILIQARALEKEDRLEDALEVYRAALPMVGSHTKVKIQEAIRNVEERSTFDGLLAQAWSLEAQRDYAGALKVLKDAEKIGKDSEQIRALQEVRGRIAKVKEQTPRATPRATPQVCITCRGEGRIQCAACEGKRRIEETCYKCKGHGYLICGQCNGRGARRCTSCRSGQQICLACGGSGRGLPIRRNGKTYSSRCGTCRGQGKIACRRCGGDAYIDCPNCVAGKASCGMCAGRGFQIKAIICRECKRTGFTPCPNCQGTGKTSSPGK